ncbi:MAG: gamma-glutamyltransferase [Betaproteobacteria bacterium]|nr:gamma-glutamyltransferase [Betaproteobacteria bacterium]
MRPTIIGRQHAVSCGHYLATAAAMRVLERGGNAVDAGVTAAMALSVLQPNVVSFAGVAPTLIYLREEDRVVSLAGLGYWPAATDASILAAKGNGCIPDGLLQTVMPAAPATHVKALQRYGTITFEEAATPAYQLAKDGFSVYPMLAYNIERVTLSPSKLDEIPIGFDRYPENARIFLPKGRPPKTGDIFRQEDLARTIHGMIEAERNAKGDRSTKLRAVHDFFYKGPIADAIVKYHVENAGFVRKDDLAGFEVPIESSISCSYRGLRVHTCDVWCQGVVLLEALKILECFDLKRFRHNSLAYIHTLAEAMNLAFSDRESYVGDPKFVDVPTAGMLSDEYALLQHNKINPSKAFGAMPPPGDPWAILGRISGKPVVPKPASREQFAIEKDTIYTCVVDRFGNAYSGTPSDNVYDTPIIPGTGLAISSRGNQSRLQPGHPAEVRPGKRPRLTPSPALAFKDGKFYFAFGTPGGDVQTQAMLQVLLNVYEFGMTVQAAVEAPRFGTFNFPNSFSPNQYLPGRLCVESGVLDDVRTGLREAGHDVEDWPAYAPPAGGVCAIKADHETATLHAGADPRREGYAMAW